jgi:hypothetical protein
MANVKMEIELKDGKRIYVEEEGIDCRDYEKEDEFSLSWDDVWDACDKWRE